ncbi:MAG: hypothetical protein JWQ79_3263 [Mucilaginibacter sp.]|jgi:hypothetical protein|nr:hypothetical protein [Mucilaginibacter sp.]
MLNFIAAIVKNSYFTKKAPRIPGALSFFKYVEVLLGIKRISYA